MSIESLAGEAVAFSVPLAMEFRSTQNREGVVFQGPSGWGEFAPFPEYDDVIAGRWLAGALEMAFGKFPNLVRTQVPVNAIVPATDEMTAYELVERAIKRSGITTVKVKVAQVRQSLADDVARIRAVRSALSSNGIADGKIRLDVNGGWSLERAQKELNTLVDAANGLDYVEQPCANLSDLKKLRGSTDVLVAVDEGLRLAADFDVLAIRDAADILIVKSLPLGGVVQTLRLIDRIGLPVVVSGSMDTSVGLASSLFLAGSVAELYGACGVGTGPLLALDLVHTTKLAHNGGMDVERTNPDPDCLAVAHALTSQQQQTSWRERMVRAWYASAQDLVSPEVKHAVLAC
ncbi:MAG: o-succinylbenzoate synthase [Actinomycetes bacterium]